MSVQTPPPAAMPGWVTPALGAVTRLLLIIIPYAMGRAFVGGWWHALGLGTGLDRYTVDDYLFFGFFALVGGTTDFMSDGLPTRLLQVVAGVTLLVAMYVVIDRGMDALARRMRSVSRRRRVRARLARWARKGRGLLWLRGPLLFGFLTVPMIALWSGLVVFALLPVACAERAGYRDGERLARRMQDPQLATRYPLATLTPAAGGGVTRLMQCSSDWCVVHVAGRFHAVPKARVAHAGPAPLPAAAAKTRTLPADTAK